VTPPADTAAAGLRERHKQSTRQALVGSALQLFDDRGYSEVTVEDICAAVEVSPRTFFRYFPAKKDVLAAPITSVLEVIRAALFAAPLDAQVWSSLRGALGAALHHVDEQCTDFLRVGRVLRDTPSLLASDARALMEWEETVRSEVARRLGTHAADLEPRLVVGLAMLAFRTALDLWSESDGRQSASALLASALDAVEPGARSIIGSHLR